MDPQLSIGLTSFDSEATQKFSSFFSYFSPNFYKKATFIV
jgi:hypothetical protein